MLTSEQINIILSVVPDAQPKYLNNDSPIVRIGYWNRIPKQKLEEINNQLTIKGMWLDEIDDFDEDCGYVFFYEVKLVSKLYLYH